MFDLDSALGIEIQEDRLVLATVSKGLQGFHLKGHCVIENHKVMEFADLRKKIQQFLRSNGFNRENVLLGLPRHRVVVRHVELPLEVEENLDQVVRFQVDKLEPTEEKQSYYDYVVLERNQKERSLLLQIIMVPQAFIDEQLDLFRQLNLYPAAVRPSSVGLSQIFSIHKDGYGREPSIVLNMGGDFLEIVVVDGTKKCFSHRVGLSAEELSIDRILLELDAFIPRLHLAGEEIDKIYLAGDRAQEFLGAFRDRFQDCELLLKGLRIKHRVRRQSRLEELLQAVGLAVSGLHKSSFSRLNLIPKEKRVVGQRPSFVPTLVLVGLLAVMGMAAGTRRYVQQQRLLEALTAETQRLKPEVDRILAIRRQEEERLAQAKELQTLMQGRQRVLLVLKDLTETIPEDAYLRTLNILPDKVTLTGFSDSASALINVLQGSRYLTNVESKYITRDRSTGKEKFSFEAAIRSVDETVAP